MNRKHLFNLTYTTVIRTYNHRIKLCRYEKFRIEMHVEMMSRCMSKYIENTNAINIMIINAIYTTVLRSYYDRNTIKGKERKVNILCAALKKLFSCQY